MRILKNIWSQMHRFILWAVVLTLFWLWVYSNLMDPAPAKKVVLYVDAYELEERALSLRLEDEGLPEGIKMIQLRSGDYDFLGGDLQGDVYLMKESILKANLEQSSQYLTPIPVPEGMTGYTWNGQNYGILAYDAAEEKGPAMSFILYTYEGDPDPESYYLCFDARSLHLDSLPEALDNAAWETAMTFLALAE